MMHQINCTITLRHCKETALEKTYLLFMPIVLKAINYTCKHDHMNRSILYIAHIYPIHDIDVEVM